MDGNMMYRALIESQMQLLQRQMVEKTENAILALLTGARCVSCGEDAKHIEFGPYEMIVKDWNLEFYGSRFSLVRAVNFLCDEHWPHGDCTVAELAN